MTQHPCLPGKIGDGATLADTEDTWPMAGSQPVYASPYLSVAVDTIVAADGARHPRVVVRPHGAVGIIAVDADDRILLVEQYRHPVGQRLLEIPAGTLDVVGESPVDAAVRELAEEADLRAGHWESVLHLLATPGYSSEGWEVFRACDLSPVAEAERTERKAEEAGMVQWWIPFADALEAVLAGRIRDSMTVSAILATHVLRGR